MGIKRTLSIGDIHGRNIWKNLTHGTIEDYEIWRTAIDSGTDVNAKVFKSMPYRKFDKIIFVGDYVDSFTVDNLTMKLNLLEIIHLKKALGDKVVLLIGNHDVSYIVPNNHCSGFRPEMKLDFYQIYTDNMGLFKAAHEEVDKHGRLWLWTHAGVTTGWISELRSVLSNPTTRFYKITKDWDLENVANLINNAWELRIPSLFNVDTESGGFSSWAGPFWVRPKKLNLYSPIGINQVVGHTPCENMWSNLVSEQDRLLYHNFFIDCLEHGSGIGFEKEL